MNIELFRRIRDGELEKVEVGFQAGRFIPVSRVQTVKFKRTLGVRLYRYLAYRAAWAAALCGCVCGRRVFETVYGFDWNQIRVVYTHTHTHVLSGEMRLSASLEASSLSG